MRFGAVRADEEKPCQSLFAPKYFFVQTIISELLKVGTHKVKPVDLESANFFCLLLEVRFMIYSNISTPVACINILDNILIRIKCKNPNILPLYQ